MNFYFILINFFYVYFVCAVGFLVNKNFLKLEIDKELTIISGIIYISLIGLLINFFLPLSKLVNTIFLFYIILYSLFYYKEIITKKNLKLFFILGFINIFLILGTHHNRPDALIYHLPYIATLNEEKVIFGLNNINYRFGHTAIIQYLSAMSNNYLFGTNGISLYLPIAFSSLIYFFYKEIKKTTNNFLRLLSVFFLCIILIKLNRVSEYGNDYWSHFYFLLGFYLVLKSIIKKKFNYEDFFQLSIILSFAFLNKIFLIVGGIYLVFITKKFNKINYFFNKKNIFILFFLIIFFFKNVINTGCIIYPLDQTCFKNLNWTAKINNYGNAKKVSVDSESWSKDWPNFFRYNQSKITQEEYISNFVWFDTWKKNHLLQILKKIFPVIILIIIMSTMLSNNKVQEKLFNKKLLFISFFILSIWFLKFPLYRFGLSIIIVNIICIFFYFLQKYKKSLLNKKKIIFLITLCLLISIFQNSKKIIKNRNELIPNIYAEQTYNKVYNNDNEFIMNLSKMNYCGYTALCSNFDNSNNIILSDFFNYKIYNVK
jgi:hypothetical protein